MKIKLAIALLAVAFAACNRLPDDTDDRAAGRSSDLKLYTDYGTGCQYVRPGGYDGITPRMGPDGKQICNGGRNGTQTP